MPSVIVPTLNAASQWNEFAAALLQCVSPDQVVIIDSASTDRTAELAHKAGFAVISIDRAAFNHGGTRQLGVEHFRDADILVFLTQDAVLTDSGSIRHLVRAFDDPTVAAAYGRQLPRPGAEAIEAHARLFNYPEISQKRDFSHRTRLGFKTIFISNSFAAYRRSALLSVGGFPSDVIFGEDTITAARLLQEGWKIEYVPKARVFHSHSDSIKQDFKRYFDIGVLHSRESWLVETFGTSTGEGSRFIKSEIAYLMSREKSRIPQSIVRSALKLAGYKLGLMERHLPPAIKARLSMHRAFWSQSETVLAKTIALSSSE